MSSGGDEDSPFEGRFIGDSDFKDGFSQTLEAALNTKTWGDAWNLERTLSELSTQIASAEAREGGVRELIRKHIFPTLQDYAQLEAAGVYASDPEYVKTVLEHLLIPGQVSALNSIVVAHDNLSLGITQIGLVVTSYGGTSGHFSQRFYRRELATRNQDELKEVMACLDRRHAHSGQGQRDLLSELARRGIRAYAERAILLEQTQSEWILGPGNPCSREMLTGSGYTRLLKKSLALLRKLIKEHKKFVFVSPLLEERAYLTIGDALRPGEYAIIQTLEGDSTYYVERWHYDAGVRDEALDFVKECGPDVVIGLYRAAEHAAPRLFYAHRENVHTAAHLAIADSLIGPEQDYPMLLDVAAVTCRSMFGSEAFQGLVYDAHTRAGLKPHNFGER